MGLEILCITAVKSKCDKVDKTLKSVFSNKSNINKPVLEFLYAVRHGGEGL
jgi:hypothetical protein